MDLFIPHTVLLDFLKRHKFTICRSDWNRKRLAVVGKAAGLVRVDVSAIVE